MKGIDILCTSEAATAIRLNMDEPSSSSSSSTTSGPAIDRHNPIIRDEKRVGKSFITPPCSNPQYPISPKPHSNSHHHYYYKSIASSSKTKKGFYSSGNTNKKKNSAVGEQKRKGSSQGMGMGMGMGGWGCTKPGAFISPPSSSRYLLSDKALLNVLNDFDPILTLVQKDTSHSSNPPFHSVKRDESSSSSSSSSAFKQEQSPSSRSPDQVVVLRVSLHCKGCERKMRKHISRMEGVTSFNIDFAAKKLTVVGDVTPLSVLASVSKVKNATLLTPTTISSTSTAPIPPPPAPVAASNYAAVEVKKYQEIVV